MIDQPRAGERALRWRLPRRMLAALAVTAALLAVGCTSQDDPAPEVPPLDSPLADCAELTIPPAQAPEAPPAATGDSRPLPELTLTCLTGGEPFHLAELRGPAVVNVWATWCRPCLTELPVMQRYADQYAGQVHVVGVATRSDPAAAVELARELELRFPSLHDYHEELFGKLGLFAMPSTLLIDHTGQLRYVYQQVPFQDEHELAELVEQHLGVASGRVEG